MRFLFDIIVSEIAFLMAEVLSRSFRFVLVHSFKPVFHYRRISSCGTTLLPKPRILPLTQKSVVFSCQNIQEYDYIPKP